MENTPLISVIVPVYNVKEFLTQCVESLINQTYKNLEVLLVDDGSTDGSGKLCDELSAKYNNVRAFHKQNGGLSDARNYGIRQAKGEYLTFLDSDDWLLPEAVEQLYKIAFAGNADIVVSRLMTYSKGKFYPHRMPEIPSDYAIVPLRFFLLRSACGKIYKTEFLKSNNLYFVKGLSYEDSVFWYKLLEHKPVIKFCYDSFYVYRQREGSIVHTYDYRDISHEYYGMLRIIKKLNAERALKEYYNAIVLKSIQFFVFSAPKYRKRFFIKMKAVFRKFTDYKQNSAHNILVKALCRYIFIMWRYLSYGLFYVSVLPMFILKIPFIHKCFKDKYKD